MTAPATTPPFRKIPIFRTFPPEHWMAGMTVERGRLCESCQKRWYSQSLVSTDYLDALRPAMSKLYVENACEIEKTVKAPGFRIWTPNACPDCLKSQMDTFNR